VAACLIVLGTCFSGYALAAAPAIATPAGLSLAEVKITGNEFILIQNNTGATINDLSSYWLYDFNNTNPLATGVGSSTQQLPSASINSGQTILLSASGGSTCGAAVVAKLSISLTDSGGYLEIVKQSISGGSLVQTAGDNVSWSSGYASGVIKSVPSSTSDPNNAYYRYQSGALAFAWQKADQDSSDSCQLDVAASSASTGNLNQLGSGGPEPPAEILAASVQSSGIPSDDIGLAPPLITELLANPTGTGNDSTDEFVEIYNSNNQAFDLSGFTIEVGLTTKHDYTFDDGSAIPAKTFAAYYSSDTHLTLSNTGGQAWLLDPNGGIISQSDGYGSAKDGQSWALANGKWYWTSKPTPGAANIIAGSSSSSKSKTNTTPTVAGLSTGSGGLGSSGAGSSSASTQPAPIHPWTLAGVAAAALLYAGYEYRADLANHIYRLRRYFAARQSAGK